MRSFILLFPVVVFALFLLASCSSSSIEGEQIDDGSGGCKIHSDCPDGNVCYNGSCEVYCDANTPCADGNVCDSEFNFCRPGGMHEDGDIEVDKAATDGDSELDLEDEIETVCTEGDLRCNPKFNDRLQKCQDEHWELFEFCKSYEVCRDGECVNPNASDGDEEKDEPDKDTDPDLTDGDEEPDMEEDTGECRHGDKRCNDNDRQICDNGVWTTFDTCPGGTVCQDAICVPDTDGDSDDIQCVCSEADGPCCDGCLFYDATHKCEDLDPLVGCDFGTGCGSSTTKRIRQRYCSGYSPECDGSTYTFDPVQDVQCDATQHCNWNAEQGAFCEEDPTCNCECSSGPCCSNFCHYDTSTRICNYNAEEETYCSPIDPNHPDQLCGGIYKKRVAFQYCTGNSNACTGSIVYQPEEMLVEQCVSTKKCDEDASGCVNAENCQWACSSGACCDAETHSFKLSGTVCAENVGEEFGCQNSQLCGDDYGRRPRHRTCSGYNASCDGPEVYGEWEILANCPSHQNCSAQIHGCIDDDLCSCNCSSGPCCDGCHYLPSYTVCQDNLDQEIGCPWGHEAGSDTGVRIKQQYCTGSDEECTGVVKFSDWNMGQDCEETEACDNGECINTEPCQSDTDCPESYYCRNGDCKEHVFPCATDDDCPHDLDNYFCNTLYGECIALDPCGSSDDCHDHPDGPNCDSQHHFCYGANCNPDSNNCRPGMFCILATLYVDNGYYCLGCENNDNCSDGMTCRNRPWLSNACVFE